MRPLLIHNYEHELIAKKEDFLELFMKEGDLWEKMYLQEKYDDQEVADTRSQRGHSIYRHLERRISVTAGLRTSAISSKGPRTPTVNKGLKTL